MNKDRNNYEKYRNGAQSAPLREVIQYITSIILTAVLGVICVVASMGINYSKTSSINIEELVSSLIGIVLSSSIIISLFYPIMFKFGATNGRIILFMVVFGIAGIVALIGNIVDMTSIVNAMNGLDNYSFMSVPIICVILLVLSYLISDKIYTNKEF